MRELFAAAMVAFAALVAPRALASESARPSCIAVRKEARYGAYAYNHVVILTNGCERPATCTVATNVNPEKRSVRLVPGETKEVVTFIGSPARDFQPDVSCTIEASR